MIPSEEAVFFEAPPPASASLQETAREELVRVLAPDFQPGHKWQVALAGDKPFHALIQDEGFLHRVRAHQVKFGPDDI